MVDIQKITKVQDSHLGSGIVDNPFQSWTERVKPVSGQDMKMFLKMADNETNSLIKGRTKMTSINIRTSAKKDLMQNDVRWCPRCGDCSSRQRQKFLPTMDGPKSLHSSVASAVPAVSRITEYPRTTTAEHPPLQPDSNHIGRT